MPHQSKLTPSGSASAWSLEHLDPASYALVMATGIVSIASHLLGMPAIARVLLGVNVAAAVVLWSLYAARAIRYPRAAADDLASHARGPGYFTLVAGTCVLGTQFVIVLPLPAVAAALWLLAVVLYAVLIYTVFLCLIVRADKPPLERGVNGGWLVAVVATQAVSLLGGHVYRNFPAAEHEILFATLALWLAGGMLYVWIIALIFYRVLFFPMKAADMGAAYWIDTGAMAISTLAGATLIGNTAADPLLAGLRPFLVGMTILFWATATWWIPMLVLFGVWRHVLSRYPLRYEVGLWGMVFPLGMYTACSEQLAGAIAIPMLGAIARVFVYVALAAWAVTSITLVRALLRHDRD